MARPKLVQKLVRQQNPLVARLLGLDRLHGFNLTIERPGAMANNGAAAETSGTNIAVNRRWLRGTSRADLRGALSHELYHAYAGTEGAGSYGADPAAQETRADAVRFALTGHSRERGGGQWDPTNASRLYARRMGWTGAGVQQDAYRPGGNGGGNNQGGNQGDSVGQPNGPRAGHSTGRSRNTLVNNRSKQQPGGGGGMKPQGGGGGGYPGGMAGVPVVSPGSAVGYGTQAGQLQTQLFQQLAQIAAQKGVIRGTYRTAVADARDQMREGMSSAENTSLESGLLGSSIDAAGRIGVKADQTRAVEDALQQRAQGKLALQGSRLDAQNSYYNGLFSLLAQKRAEQAQMATDAFMQDQVMRAGDESAQGLLDIKKMLANQFGNNNDNGGGGGGGGSGFNARTDPMLPGPAGYPNTAAGRAAQLAAWRQEAAHPNTFRPRPGSGPF